jgi:signal transduction histidine kinase
VITKFLNSLKVSHKLQILMVIPLLGLLFFSAHEITKQIRLTQQMENLGQLVTFTFSINDTVHELQKERGASAGLLGSSGYEFKEILKNQRYKTDQAILDMREALRVFKDIGSDSLVGMDAALSQIERLSEVRIQVMRRGMSIESELDYFSSLNERLLNVIAQSTKLEFTSVLNNRIIAYTNFLFGKEHAGIERALLAHIFARGFFERDQYQFFLRLKTKQDVLFKAFKQIANENELLFYQNILQDASFEQTVRFEKKAVAWAEKRRIAKDIYSLIGYGGSIHLFKNYVLRGSEEVREEFLKNHQQFIQLYDQFLKIDGLSEQDIADIETIKTTFDQYNANIKRVTQSKLKKLPIHAVDILVKIDDAGSILALHRLSRGGDIGVDATQWYKWMTRKINTLKSADIYIANELIMTSDRLKRDAYKSLWLTIVRILVLIGISMTIVNVVVNNLKGALANFIDKTIEIKNSDDLSLRFQKNSSDEFGDLSDTFNSLLEKIKILTNSLEKTNIFNSLLINTIPFGLDIVDMDGTILLMNDRLLDLVGENGVGQKCWEVYRDNKEQCENCPIPNHDVLMGKVSEIEVMHCLGGKALQITHAGIEYDGKPALIEVFQDITERNAIRGKLKQSVDDIRSFSYMLSHDLKSPLSGINQVAEWMREDYGEALGLEGSENLDLIQNRISRMYSLIDGVTQFLKMEDLEEEPSRLDSKELIDDVVDLLNVEKNINMAFVGEFPIFYGPKTKLQHLFHNLIGNAIKYMDKELGNIEIGVSGVAEFFKFYVKDNGPGIEKKYHQKIFDLFQVLQDRDVVYSTGIGLSLVKKLVEQWGGSVWVESEVGQGSTFYFTIPTA